MLTLNVRYVGTCLPCYVADHCNGDAELLVGVPVDGSTRLYQLRDEIIREASQNEKIPESVTEEQIRKAVAEMMLDLNVLTAFDGRLEKPSGDDDFGEFVYAWFRLTWSEA